MVEMIVLFVGDSGVGKSTIVSKVSTSLENVNLVKSYTTRPKRDEYDDDHTFIDSVDEINDTIVASTIINNHFYGASEKQFKKDMINLYIVDDKGVVDIKKFFSNELIITFHINRDYDNVIIPKVRKNRTIKKMGLEYDEEIDNNSSIDNAVKEVIRCIRKYQKMNY